MPSGSARLVPARVLQLQTNSVPAGARALGRRRIEYRLPNPARDLSLRLGDHNGRDNCGWKIEGPVKTFGRSC